jgi:hypothetical protein
MTKDERKFAKMLKVGKNATRGKERHRFQLEPVASNKLLFAIIIADTRSSSNHVKISIGFTLVPRLGRALASRSSSSTCTPPRLRRKRCQHHRRRLLLLWLLALLLVKQQLLLLLSPLWMLL